jgi:PAS domain S-box-containing protein
MKAIKRNSLAQSQDLSTIGFVTLDKRGRIRQINKKGASLLGFTQNWLVDRSFVVFVAKQDVDRFLGMLMQAARQPDHKIAKFDLIIENRSVPVQISLTSVLVGTESVIYELEIVDLTEIQRTETQLRASIAQWHSLAMDSPDVIMTLDHSGKISFVNMPLWGSSVTALVGTSIFDYVPETARLKMRRHLELTFRSGKRSACEINGVNNDWQSWYSITFGPGNISDGTTAATTALIRNITEHKRTEEIFRASADELRRLTARAEAIREEERTRLAREIHDELGQALTILKLDLSWLHQNLAGPNPKLRKRLKSMIEHVDHTIESVRRISSELRPSILDDAGLVAAIEWQAAEVQKRTGVRIRIDSNSEMTELQPETSVTAFRIVQEALTNVLRHAQASRVQISLKKEADALRISVADNGRGMTQEQMSASNSLGIVGMNERIAKMGGDFAISSRPGKGTRLDMIIPTH